MRSVWLSTHHGLKQLLVDTGANICTFNYTAVENWKDLDETRKMRIRGIGGAQYTLGAIPVIVNLGDYQMVQEFQVMPQEGATPYDGIIGLNFLKTLDAVYDLKEENLRLRWAGAELTIPFEGANTNEVTVPPRCEMCYRIPVSGSGEVVTTSRELTTGVYLARTITKVQDGEALVMLMNTRSEPVTLKGLEADSQPLDHYEVIQRANRRKRRQLLAEKLKLDHLKGPHQAQLQKLCLEYADIFQLDDDPLSTTSIGRQKIHIKPGTVPVYKKPFRNPFHQRHLVREYVEKLKKQKIIEPSVSAWNAPLLLIPKKNKDEHGNRQYRVCIDYRGLNAVLEQDKYPLPNIQDMIDQLGKSKYFTTMDLSQGYFQVELEEESRPVTAFITPDGEHYQMTRMPMGLSTSPSGFMRMMNIALTGLKGTHCLVYIDDIIVFSRTVDEHMRKLREVFQRLREVKLKIHPQKTTFCKSSVMFLGFQIDGDGIKMDPSKKAEIDNWPVPSSKADVQQFFGLANFYGSSSQNLQKKEDH